MDEDVEEYNGTLAYLERTTSELLQCRGCGHVCMRQIYHHTGIPEDEIEQYPSPVSRRKPAWISTLSFCFADTKSTLRELFGEVYACLYARHYRLAAMGTRAIIDLVLNDKLGDIGGFERKLEVATRNGLLTDQQRNHLAAAVDTGSAASHRAYKPNPKQLATMLDIVEHTVHLLYVLDHPVSQLTESTPKRSDEVRE